MSGLSFGLSLLGLSFGVLMGIGVTGGTVFLVVVVGTGVDVAVVVGTGVDVAVAVGVCWVARTCSDLLVSLLSVIVAGGVVWSGGTSW